MTVDEFFEALETTPREWRFDDGSIRMGGHCPVSAVAVERRLGTFHALRYADAGRALGLDEDVTSMIVESADGTAGPTRDRLLSACGLEILHRRVCRCRSRTRA